MANVKQWLIVEACGITQISAPGCDGGWGCVSDVVVHSVW